MLIAETVLIFVKNKKFRPIGGGGLGSHFSYSAIIDARELKF